MNTKKKGLTSFLSTLHGRGGQFRSTGMCQSFRKKKEPGMRIAPRLSLVAGNGDLELKQFIEFSAKFNQIRKSNSSDYSYIQIYSFSPICLILRLLGSISMGRFFGTSLNLLVTYSIPYFLFIF